MNGTGAELRRVSRGRVLDIGCGAARNAVPLAQQGWDVLGVDRSWPMIAAAAERRQAEGVADRVMVARAAMDALPGRDCSFDLLVAHGIWNLASSCAEFRRAVREAARVAAPGAALFVFTFSRNTFPESVRPVAAEPLRVHAVLRRAAVLPDRGAVVRGAYGSGIPPGSRRAAD